MPANFKGLKVVIMDKYEFLDSPALNGLVLLVSRLEQNMPFTLAKGVQNKKQSRVHEIDAEIKETLEYIEYLKTQKTDTVNTLNPDQFEAAYSKFVPLEDVLINASKAISLIKRNNNPWRKGKNTLPPHIVSIWKARKELNKLTKPIISAKKRWEIQYNKIMGEFNFKFNDISGQLDAVANSYQSLNDDYLKIHAKLLLGYYHAAMTEGNCENLHDLQNKFHLQERNLGLMVSDLLSQKNKIDSMIKKEREELKDGKSVLSKRDIMDKESGIAGKSSDIESRIMKFRLLKDDKTFFYLGLTPENSYVSNMFRTIEQAENIEKYMKNIDSYKETIEKITGFFEDGSFISSSYIPFSKRDIQIQFNETLKLSESIRGYDTLKYCCIQKIKFVDLEKLHSNMQLAYNDAVNFLALEAGEFDNLTIKSEDELDSARTRLYDIIKNIDCARKHDINGAIDTQEVVSEKDYKKLKDFYDNIDQTRKELFSSVEKINTSIAVSEFKRHLSRAENELENYGTTDPDFRGYTQYSREDFDRINRIFQNHNSNSSINLSGKEVDSRLRPLYKEDINQPIHFPIEEKDINRLDYLEKRLKEYKSRFEPCNNRLF